uniref:DEP domain-containing protein 7 n=1 Tax=Periophthalmus magnuspinnatus TaxID=409849 RepID=A0A3B4A7P0_9GOBI
MSSIKERAAALNLSSWFMSAHVVPSAFGQAITPGHKCLQWRSLITYLKSNVTIKKRRVHMKSHSDCFLGSEAVDVVAEHLKLSMKLAGFSVYTDVTRHKVVCVCQALLDCNVFEVVGAKSTGKEQKQMFQDSKNYLYRFVDSFFPLPKTNKQAIPTPSHVEMLDVPEMESLTLEAPVDSLSLNPSKEKTGTKLPESLIDEVWQELTLLRLLNLVELPVLDGILQRCLNPVSPQKAQPPLPHINPDLIHSSNHLDRKVLKAFRDSQEDPWLCAALDCLDFLPDQSVVDPSGIQKSCYEQPLLSSSSLNNYKLLVYGALAKHYSHTDKAPLMPQHMTDIYKAIIELLVTAKLGTALEALQLCLKLLPSSNREELRRLLTFMALAAQPEAIKLDTEMENRLVVKRAFSRTILHSKSLTKEKEDLMVVFMLSNIHDIFKIPGALHKEVSDKLVHLVQGKQPDVAGSMFCVQVSKRTYVDSTKTTTNDELWKLLDNIHCNIKISSKERKRLLRQFYQAHPEVFNQYFGDSAVSLL